jgi:hypothetical protein
MNVQMIGASVIAWACATRRYPDNVKPEPEIVADQRTELKVTWPRNGAGDHMTIAELLSEATNPTAQPSHS